MTKEMLAVTTTINSLEMKLGEVTTILRALATANKRMVEAVSILTKYLGNQQGTLLTC